MIRVIGLFLLAGACALMGTQALMNATTVIHEISALLCYLGAIIFVAAAFIADAVAAGNRRLSRDIQAQTAELRHRAQRAEADRAAAGLAEIR